MNVCGPTRTHKGLIAVCAALLLILPGVNRADRSSSLAAEAVSAGMEEQVASIALYPDEVLSLVLAASTFPLQVDQAGGFLVQLKYDPDLNPDPTWDDSVVALLNYPDVVALMTADLDWTRRLGEAVRTRQADVIDAVQRFRARAVRAGNLASDERQIVTDSAGLIEVAPANPGAIYVPRYDPGRVIYRSSTPVSHYYPTPFPNYSYAYPEGHPSGFTYFWGVTSTFSIDWHARRLSAVRRFYPDSPYLGHSQVLRHTHSSPFISFFYGQHLKGRSHHRHRRAHRRGARDGNRRATNRPRRDARRPDRRRRSSVNQRATRRQEARPNRQARRRAPAANNSVNASTAQTNRSAEPARPNNRTRATRRSRRSNSASRNRRATPASTRRSGAPAAETRSLAVQAAGATTSSASPAPRATKRQRRGRARTRTKPQARAGTAVQARATEPSARSKPSRAKSKSQARRKAKARAAKRAKARQAKARRSTRGTRGERS